MAGASNSAGVYDSLSIEDRRSTSFNLFIYLYILRPRWTLFFDDNKDEDKDREEERFEDLSYSGNGRPVSRL